MRNHLCCGQLTFCHDLEPTPTSTWEEPRTIYGIEEDGWIPKVLSNPLIVTKDGEWVLPFWRENAMLAKATWPDTQEHCRTKDNSAGQKHTNSAVPYASVLVSKVRSSSYAIDSCHGVPWDVLCFLVGIHNAYKCG